MHRGQIHYPYVMFGMKTATKLDFYKNVSDKFFLHFFLHKSINQPQYCSKLLKLKKNPGFLLFNCQVHKWCHWFLEKKHTKLLIFNIKSDCGLEFFLLLSQSWACPRLGKTLALMHF